MGNTTLENVQNLYEQEGASLVFYTKNDRKILWNSIKHRIIVRII
jgi:hypothetical protein